MAMKKIITLFGAFALLTNLNSLSYAQVLEDFRPSSVNQLGKAYPQVTSEAENSSIRLACLDKVR